MRFDSIITEACENTTTTSTTTTTTTCPVPTAPSNVSLSGVDVGFMDVSWDVGSGTGQQQVWRSVNGAAYTLIDSVDPEVALISDDISGFATNTVICYKVRGHSSCGFSAFSEPSCFTVE